LEGGAARLRASLHGRQMDYTLLQTGRHWGPNSLAVLLVLEAMDVPLETSLSALAEFAPLAGRGAERTVGGVQLVDESYNANPLSMRAAMISLGGRALPGPGRRIVALTDMLELGPEAEQFHRDLAQPIEDAGVDLVFLAGPLMKALWDSLPAARQGAYAPSAAELAPVLVEAVRPGDVVMVKGSNGSKASTLAAALVAALAARETA
ncbi:MAG: UDP-N-acetylmuramoylalanyl-D-glutamyl-2, 6-diaminopimelate--D-alanyl-D-alanine ligase, partial [Pseudomonadota bacterium]|nr:UDP-N-acetylmuramoylalanyl-D-glutamyl-2, 6-diaminopimelate--D-alanyl-D-alanine ligase [Pseudomonadota bacterium]